MTHPLGDELALARSAFGAAHGRFQQSHATRDTEVWYAALGECLWWIFGLDEQYRQAGGATYEQLRDEDSNGRVLRGLRAARNSVGHGLALMLEAPPSSPSMTSMLDQLQWRPLASLPLHRLQLTPAQQDGYREELEGNPARYALRRANYFFVRHSEALDAAINP